MAGFLRRGSRFAPDETPDNLGFWRVFSIEFAYWMARFSAGAVFLLYVLLIAWIAQIIGLDGFIASIVKALK